MLLETVLIVAFWVLIAIWPLVYVVYPVGLLAFARWRGTRPMEVDLPWPTVEILVAAHNEEGTIERCVRSCLAQSYPGGPLTVVVGLDGCTDGTADVLRRIEDPRLRVVAYERQGKAATDNSLIAGCHAEVVATTSAGAEYKPGAIEALARSFRSSRVGCAGGVFAPRRSQARSAAAEATYFSLEYRLMRAESDLGILAKASGTALMFRRSLWRPIPVTSDADISLPCLIAGHGKLVTFIPDAVAIDDGPRDLQTVFRARRRMATQALANVPRHIVELAVAGYWGHATSLTLHKLLRWLAPVAFVACAIDAMALGAFGYREYPWFVVATGVIAVVLMVAVSILPGNLLSMAAGFVVSQIAFVAGAMDCLRGSGVTRWGR